MANIAIVDSETLQFFFCLISFKSKGELKCLQIEDLRKFKTCQKEHIKITIVESTLKVIVN